MPNRINLYKDKDKARKTRNAQRLRYYKKTQKALNSRKRWTDEEICAVFESGLSDTELSKQLGRSVSAIQVKRHYITWSNK